MDGKLTTNGFDRKKNNCKFNESLNYTAKMVI